MASAGSSPTSRVNHVINATQDDADALDRERTEEVNADLQRIARSLQGERYASAAFCQAVRDSRQGNDGYTRLKNVVFLLTKVCAPELDDDEVNVSYRFHFLVQRSDDRFEFLPRRQPERTGETGKQARIGTAISLLSGGGPEDLWKNFQKKNCIKLKWETLRESYLRAYGDITEWYVTHVEYPPAKTGGTAGPYFYDSVRHSDYLQKMDQFFTGLFSGTTSDSGLPLHAIVNGTKGHKYKVDAFMKDVRLKQIQSFVKSGTEIATLDEVFRFPQNANGDIDRNHIRQLIKDTWLKLYATPGVSTLKKIKIDDVEVCKSDAFFDIFLHEMGPMEDGGAWISIPFTAAAVEQIEKFEHRVILARYYDVEIRGDDNGVLQIFFVRKSDPFVYYRDISWEGKILNNIRENNKKKPVVESLKLCVSVEENEIDSVELRPLFEYLFGKAITKILELEKYDPGFHYFGHFGFAFPSELPTTGFKELLKGTTNDVALKYIRDKFEKDLPDAQEMSTPGGKRILYILDDKKSSISLKETILKKFKGQAGEVYVEHWPTLDTLWDKLHNFLLLNILKEKEDNFFVFKKIIVDTTGDVDKMIGVDFFRSVFADLIKLSVWPEGSSLYIPVTKNVLHMVCKFSHVLRRQGIKCKMISKQIGIERTLIENRRMLKANELLQHIGVEDCQVADMECGWLRFQRCGTNTIKKQGGFYLPDNRLYQKKKEEEDEKKPPEDEASDDEESDEKKPPEDEASDDEESDEKKPPQDEASDDEESDEKKPPQDEASDDEESDEKKPPQDEASDDEKPPKDKKSDDEEKAYNESVQELFAAHFKDFKVCEREMDLGTVVILSKDVKVTYPFFKYGDKVLVECYLEKDSKPPQYHVTVPDKESNLYELKTRAGEVKEVGMRRLSCDYRQFEKRDLIGHYRVKVWGFGNKQGYWFPYTSVLDQRGNPNPGIAYSTWRERMA